MKQPIPCSVSSLLPLSLTLLMAACVAPTGSNKTPAPPGGMPVLPVAGTPNPNPPAYAPLASGTAMDSTGTGVSTLVGDGRRAEFTYAGSYDNTNGDITVTATTSPALNFSATGSQRSRTTYANIYSKNGYSLTIFDPRPLNDTALFDLVRTPITGSYTFVRGVGFSSPAPYLYNSAGFLGIGTTPDNMPVEGSATYSGIHALDIRTANGQATYKGDSRIVVDFTGGTVDVTLDNPVQFGGFGTRPPLYTSIAGTGMSVSGNRFSGGTWLINNKGTTTTPSTTKASGSFYGYDANISAPDEVAGLGYLTNATTSWEFTFAGD